jgi:hypothetical protein
VLVNLRVLKTFAFGCAAETPQTGATTARSGRPYNLIISMSARNVLNHDNPGPHIGNIASPLFGRANQPFGATTLGGTGLSESANPRRLEFHIRCALRWHLLKGFREL